MTAVVARVDIGSRCVTERTTVPGRHRCLSLAKTTATLMMARDDGARRRERRRSLQGIVVGPRNRQERQWRGGLRCLDSIVGRLSLACWTAARAAEHAMALARLIDGDDAGEAEDSV